MRNRIFCYEGIKGEMKLDLRSCSVLKIENHFKYSLQL